jgi:diguanylate cyclase (GGDEF)-like protein
MAAVRIYDQDFRYLLLHLVPQHRLSPGLRRDVDHALRNGETDTLRREAVRALEELCENAYFERTGVRTENGRVVVGYRRKGGSYQLSVALPRAEIAWLGPAATTAPSAASPVPTAVVPTAAPEPAGAAPAPPVVAPGARAEIPHADDIIPVIMRSFAIVDRAMPVLERIDVLLGALERWLGMSYVGLDVLEDTLVAGEADPRARVRVLSEVDLRASEVARAAIESGTRRLIPRANLDTPGPGGAVWEVLGIAPIFALGKVVGALRACFPAGLDRTAMDAALETAAGVVRHVIEFHHQFENLTSVDSLTGIYNRQFFDRQLPVEIERAMRSGTALSILVADIDDFKRINDELGHKKGDEALAAVADIVKRNLRKIDTPFRYGGEEIVILLPGTPEFEAVHTAERLRRVIQQHRGFRDGRGNPREITVSVGVAVYPDTAKTGDQLFSQADEAMYRAKQRGKNQVVLYSNS